MSSAYAYEGCIGNSEFLETITTRPQVFSNRRSTHSKASAKLYAGVSRGTVHKLCDALSVES